MIAVQFVYECFSLRIVKWSDPWGGGYNKNDWVNEWIYLLT
jgi:hypothetical protein